MAEALQWLKDLETALDQAQTKDLPILVAFDAEPLAKDFNIKWTPTLITLSKEGKEHHRTVGFLDPDAFIASSLLGVGKSHFDNNRFPEALDLFEKIIAESPETDSVPEVIFL